jgi:hypothetical protein
MPSSTPSRHLVAVALAAFTLTSAAAARPARAATIEDLVTGLRLDVAAPGVDVCVVTPRAARTSEGCAGDRSVVSLEAGGASVLRTLA